jgi:hypothetical protein
MKKVLAVLLMLGLASVAQASLSVVVTPQAQFTVLGGPATAYLVQVVGSTGDKMTAANVIFTGCVYQIGYKMTARPFTFNYTPTDEDATAQLFTPIIEDSHFIVNFAAIVTPPTENNDQFYGLNSYGDTEGKGNLWVSSGIELSQQQQTEDLANIVLLNSCLTGAWLDGGIANAQGVITSLHVFIPEPATLVLLTLGGLGLIRRRR